MAERAPRSAAGRPGGRRPPYSVLVAALAALLILLGFLLWFLPYLKHEQLPVTGVPTPPALFSLAEFTVPPGGEACMSTVTLEARSGYALFDLRPARPSRSGGPPVELVLSAPGYTATAHVPGGYPGGSVTLPVAAPKRSEIGSACFVDRGRTPVDFDGTTEPRTVASRTGTTIDGRSVVGDIALSFLGPRPRSALQELGTIFGHASELTDHLVPVWLIWIIAVLCLVCVPGAVVAALYLSLREQPAAG